VPPLVIYISGEQQHAGKTVASMGLISVLSRRIDPADIGYIKPVGQDLVELENGERIDKDALVIEELSCIPDLDAQLASPVRLASGMTKDYLGASDRAARTAAMAARIEASMRAMHRKRVIVAEGTGHPGVGSVVGLSNAQVCSMLDAHVLYLSGGGLGRAIDAMDVQLTYLLRRSVRVQAILFNKVFPSKIGQMRKFLDEPALKQRYPELADPFHVLGYLPEVKDLGSPCMTTLAYAFKDRQVVGDPGSLAWQVPCRQTRVISQGNEDFLPEAHLAANDLVVLGAGSRRRLRKVLDFNESLKPDGQLGGLILTCSDRHGEFMRRNIDDVRRSGLPAIYVPCDTSDTDLILYNCFRSTKLQTYDVVKFRQIEQLFAEHFDAERFFAMFGL
jgi:uncharacterized protein